MLLPTVKCSRGPVFYHAWLDEPNYDWLDESKHKEERKPVYTLVIKKAYRPYSWTNDAEWDDESSTFEDSVPALAALLCAMEDHEDKKIVFKFNPNKKIGN